MVDIKTELSPFRLRIGDKRGIEFTVEITNDADKPRTISCDLILGNQIAFDKQGRQNAITRRFGEMQPGERIREYLYIFPRMNIQPGEQPIVITAIEHFEKKYDYILGKKTKRMALRIE